MKLVPHPHMARSDTESTYMPEMDYPLQMLLTSLTDENDEDLDQKNDRTIHSGQFMVSHVHDYQAEYKAESARVKDDVTVDDNSELACGTDLDVVTDDRSGERCESGTLEKMGAMSSQLPVPRGIDTSLARLFKCMTLAYSGKLTSPKWKHFKGVKVLLKDKIRLNNIIWREWFMQYIKGTAPIVCQFEPPISNTSPTNPEVVRLEGRRWKLRLDSVTNDYKKWSRYFRERFAQSWEDPKMLNEVSCCSLLEHVVPALPSTPHTDLVTSSVSSQPVSAPLSIMSMFQDSTDQLLSDEDFFLDVSDTLFTSLNAASHASAESGAVCGNIDWVLKSNNGQLQPNQDKYMDTLEPSQMRLAVDFKGFGRLSSLSAATNYNASSSSSSLVPSFPFSSTQQGYTKQQQQRNIWNKKEVGNTMNLLSASTSFVSVDDVLAEFRRQCSSGLSFSDASTSIDFRTRSCLGAGTEKQTIVSNSPSVVSCDNSSSIDRVGSSVMFVGGDSIDDDEDILDILLKSSAYDTYHRSPTPQLPVIEEVPGIESELDESMRFGSDLCVTPQNSAQRTVAASWPHSLGDLQLSGGVADVFNFHSASTGSLHTRETGLEFRLPQPRSRTLKSAARRASPTLDSLFIPQMSASCSLRPSSQSINVSLNSPLQQPRTDLCQRVSLLETLLTHDTPAIKVRSAPGMILSAEVEQKRRRIRHKSDHSVGHLYTSTSTVTSAQYALCDSQNFTPTKHLRHPVGPVPIAPNPAGRSADNFVRANAVFQPINPVNKPPYMQLHLNSMTATAGQHSAIFQPIRPLPATCFSTRFATILRAAPVPTHSSSVEDGMHSSSADLRQRGSIGRYSCPSNESSATIISSSTTYSDETASCARLPVVLLPSSSIDNDDELKELEQVVACEINKDLNKELKRVSHITSEKKRRTGIKSGFDRLNQLMPGIVYNPNVKISKATTLHKAIELCKKMKFERSQKHEEAEQLRMEVKSLELEISVMQSRLPVAGVPLPRHQDAQQRHWFDEYILSRARNNWKFWIFSMIVESLFDSFNDCVSTTSVDILNRSVLDWCNRHCSLIELRPVVSNAVRRLSTTTSILTNPASLPDQVEQSATSHRRHSTH